MTVCGMCKQDEGNPDCVFCKDKTPSPLILEPPPDSESQPFGYYCPSCGVREIETGINATYIRGVVFIHWFGGNQHVGCVSCMRKKLFIEACLSSVLGWYSVAALICNPFFILTNLIKIPFVKVDHAKARRMLSEAGVYLP